ncbi:MAG TPA: bifunctional glutamate N-acetyltransferase/amino-acid acetyltransferase ArgJ [Candidatus Acidoferrum sp.]|nr:bifunctional glutamate N-acetyltransferase/amino-acid acetyltransferase ArgJ [Candidatus Acidoferrum sp.]
MKQIFLQAVGGSVTAPQGFRASGVFCDIKRLGTGKGSEKGRKRDLALIVSDAPAAVAGTFTTNRVCAAPVKLCVERVAAGTARAIVVNSGNANACTGRQGLRDAEAMARAVAAACRGHGIAAREVLVASTGRIGVPLPMSHVKQGIVAAARLLASGPEGARQASEAIMTSDTRPKEAGVEIVLGGKKIRLGGIGKGAGMIHPGMSPRGARPALRSRHATMLCFLTTDAAVEARFLQTALNEAVAKSFNRITVDGDMSTNDTVLILANGRAGNPPLTGRAPERRQFQAALDHVTLELAKKMVLDGEGVSRFVTVRVAGAKSPDDADAAARAVANSALVKTSWCGGDPNWGRILCALGYSAAELVEGRIDVGYSLPGRREVLCSLKRGCPTDVSFGALCKISTAPAFDLHIHLHVGRASAVIYSGDLTEAYVAFNKGDVTDPSSLGG